MKKQLLLFVLALLPVMASADTVEIDGIYYNLYSVSNQAEVTSNPNKYAGDVIIPDKVTYKGVEYNVTSVGNSAFLWCTGLTSVTIANGVISIGDYAFQNCHNLTSIIIPNSITSIGSGPFFGCSGLTSIDLPNSLTEISVSAFSNCSGLTSVTIPNSVTSIGDYAFSNCEALTSVTIPNSVSSIGSSAFYGTAWFNTWYNDQADGLLYVGKVAYNYKGEMPANTQISIKDGTLEIADNVFSGCKGLTSINIPNSVTSIGRDAFKQCSSLTSIDIPNSVTSIKTDAFYGCSNLIAVHITDIASWCRISFEKGNYCDSNPLKYAHHLFLNGEEIKDLVIPNGVESIGSNAFYRCSGLTSVTISNSVTSIGDGAFGGCSGLTSINIPNSVISLSGFSGCTGLTSITIPNSVTSIGNSAFSSCTGLTSITIPNSVTSIAYSAFSGCTGLTSITIPNSVTSIGHSAFSGCRNLTSITIPNSVTSIGDWAFRDCNGLTSVTISDLSTWLNIDFGDNNANPLSNAHHLYLNDEEITDLIIPNGMTSINNYAFTGCRGLTSVTIPESVTSIGAYAFYKCESLTSVNIPNSITKIGNFAFDGCDNLELVLPESITKRTIHVEKAGTLGSLLEGMNYQIEELTLTGEINGSDLAVIREMAGKAIYIRKYGISSWDEFADTDGRLSVLDMSDVKIVSGGQYLYLDGLDDGDSWIELAQDDVIPAGIFNCCKKLTSISVPSGLKNVGKDAFDGTPWYENQPEGLVYIGNVLYKYKGDMPENCHIKIKKGTIGIANSAFYGRSTLSSIDIPESVKYIGINDITYFDGRCPFYQFLEGLSRSDAFRECTSLTTIKIPNGVTSIGDYVFCNCSGLTSVTIPNSVISIGPSAFSGCSALTSVTIPNSVTSISGGTFSGCSGLTSVIIPNSVTSIGYGAFWGCSGLTSVTIPSSVTYLGSGVFADCSNLATITVDVGNTVYNSPDGSNAIIETTSNKLVAGCKNTTIPNSVTSIGDYAFRGCNGLTSMTIPNSVTSIGYFAFDGCSGLTSIISEIENPFSLNQYVFYNIPSNIRLIVPKGSKETYQATDGWNQFTNIVEVVDGDANGDEDVNQADVENVESFIMGKTPSVFVRSAADMNGDEKIDVVDIVLMQNVTKK